MFIKPASFESKPLLQLVKRTLDLENFMLTLCWNRVFDALKQRLELSTFRVKCRQILSGDRNCGSGILQGLYELGTRFVLEVESVVPGL